MSFTRATTALGLAAAALALAAPLAAADESGLEINGNQPAQRGTDIRVSAAEDPFTFADEDGFITLESAAFVKPVKIREGRFIGSATAAVRCAIKPGTYTVRITGSKAAEERRSDGAGGRTETTMTVTAAMDPGNREYCASASAKKAEAQAAAADDSGSSTLTVVLTGAAAALAAAAVGTFLVLRHRKRKA